MKNTGGSSPGLRPQGAVRPERHGFDLPFFILVMTLLAFGLVMLFSASYASSYYINQDSYAYIKNQAMFACAGFVAMIVMSNLDYHFWHRVAWPLMLISWALLALVLVTPEIKNTHRWLSLRFFNVQPSEIAKFAIIVLFAHLVSVYGSRMKTFRYGVVPFIVILALTDVFVVVEPHLSATILITLIAMIIMFAGGTRLVWFPVIAGVAGGGLGATLLVFPKLAYALQRVLTSQDIYSDSSGKGLQTIQSLIAIGSGGLTGLGFGNSRQKYLYLPEPQTDFIFSIVCEELGFIGAMVVIGLFAALLWRGIVLAMRSADRFGSMLTVGIVAQVSLQAMLNIAVVTNTVPNTGITLPFFSYGGSSMMMLLGEMGIVLSVSRQNALPQASGGEEPPAAAETDKEGEPCGS